MRHLLIGTEFPPAPAGGIGTYMQRITALLTQAGEIVHVISHAAGDAPLREVSHDGRLIVHRLPTLPVDATDRALAALYKPLLFAWRAAALAEQLIADERIDLVEGAEFEAPLYFLQRRRALGLSAGGPPIVVHLHGASDIVFGADLYDPGAPYNRMAQRLEAASIAAADHIIAPSRYYADQAIATYAIPSDRLTVIPYPIAPATPIARDAAVWAGGSIAFVGRLERRKGILEWLEAASILARANPALRFEFAGGNGLVAEWGEPSALIRDAIAEDVRGCFIFHGHLNKQGLAQLLGRAKLAVVPSRWDNLPYTCLEAMGAGLPVLTTRCGGMAEVVRDGVDGWIAPSAAPGDLLVAARRALSTGPGTLSAMGESAAAQVQRVCDNTRTLERHRQLRTAIAAVRHGPPVAATAPLRMTQVRTADGEAHLFAAAARTHAHAPADCYLICERQSDANQEFADAARLVLARCADVAMVSAWMRTPSGEVVVGTDPDLPAQLLADGTIGPLLVRASVFARGLASVDPNDPPALARWAAVVDVLAAGERCVCLPIVLSCGTKAPVLSHMAHRGLQRMLHARFPHLLAAHAARLIAWAGSPTAMLSDPHELSFRLYSLMQARMQRRKAALLQVVRQSWEGRLRNKARRLLGAPPASPL